MKDEVKCPWCEQATVPGLTLLKKEHGDITERRCTHCGSVLAAYLVEEGDFMNSIRKFEN